MSFDTGAFFCVIHGTYKKNANPEWVQTDDLHKVVKKRSSSGKWKCPDLMIRTRRYLFQEAFVERKHSPV
ncbi:hypothetical protein CHISP_0370 [Chitinispirillum alkaliphilum]|nr:hypothetical protein CHISP_0370 [Chitinispirillum alkaliphilum]